MDMKKFKDTALGGILYNNPVLVLALGLCPMIAVSTNITDAFGLGAATAFVLVLSNITISLLRKVIPDKVRLPAYIVIIATLTTIVQMFVRSFLPDLDASMGSFIPLIAVNCVVLGRAEAYAKQNSVGYSALDGLSMGLGFIIAISLLGALRQFLAFIGFEVFVTTAGGFILLGLLMASFNALLQIYNERKRQRVLKGLEA